MVERRSRGPIPLPRWVSEAGRRLRESRHDPRVDRNRPGRGVAGRPGFARRPAFGWTRWGLAWAVHAYTAMGLVIAGGIAALIVRGDAFAFQASFALMILATIVDATDGTLARKVGVKEVLPNFDGRRLDDITDFLTYAFLPLFLLWRAGGLPNGCEAWLALPLLASAYGFCQTSIKTDDGYFLGFPSLWNVVALYVYALDFDPRFTLGLLVVLSVLTFVPTRYLYPSQPGRLNRWSSILGGFWSALLLFVVWKMPVLRDPDGASWVHVLGWASLSYPIYYMLMSFAVSIRLGRVKPANRPA